MSKTQMLSQMTQLTVALLLLGCCAHAAQPCGSADLHDHVMEQADMFMGPFVLFRGEVAALPPDELPSCCTGSDCVSIQCSAPVLPPDSMPPAKRIEYAIGETLWGQTKTRVIASLYNEVSQCGKFEPVVHERIITLCSAFEGALDAAEMWCELPIADIETNLREVRE